jgi:hypothetical protein
MTLDYVYLGQFHLLHLLIFFGNKINTVLVYIITKLFSFNFPIKKLNGSQTTQFFKLHDVKHC